MSWRFPSWRYKGNNLYRREMAITTSLCGSVLACFFSNILLWISVLLICSHHEQEAAVIYIRLSWMGNCGKAVEHTLLKRVQTIAVFSFTQTYLGWCMQFSGSPSRAVCLFSCLVYCIRESQFCLTIVSDNSVLYSVNSVLYSVN